MAPLLTMNQLCKVCGEPAAGYHFGAFTCEGCKSFFGRTYNSLSTLGDCKNNGQCEINKKNRTSCKSCRLKKCIMVGMSKSGSRYGRRSNWFKIHCLIQGQDVSGKHEAHSKHLYDNSESSNYYHQTYQNGKISGSPIHSISPGSNVESSSGQLLTHLPFEGFNRGQKNNITRIDACGMSNERKENLEVLPTFPLSPVSPANYFPPSSYYFNGSRERCSAFSSVIGEINGVSRSYITDIHYPRYLIINPFQNVLRPSPDGISHVPPDCPADIPAQESPIDLSRKKHQTSSLPLEMVKGFVRFLSPSSDDTHDSAIHEDRESPLDLSKSLSSC